MIDNIKKYQENSKDTTDEDQLDEILLEGLRYVMDFKPQPKYAKLDLTKEIQKAGHIQFKFLMILPKLLLPKDVIQRVNAGVTKINKQYDFIMQHF